MSFDFFKWAAEQAVGDDGEKIFGKKPGVADYTATDLGVEAGKAARANTANYDDILAMLDKIVPGFSAMQNQGSKNTLSMLRGELPKDVQDAVQRSSAFRSLMGGYAGSGMSKALTARDIGRTSLDLMDAGTNSAQKWAAIGEGAASPFLVTAPAQGEATFKNNLYQQAVDQFKLNVEAAPTPETAGIFNLQTTLGMTAASMGMGSLMGTGGSRPAAAPATTTSTTSGGAYPTNWWGGG